MLRNGAYMTKLKKQLTLKLEYIFVFNYATFNAVFNTVLAHFLTEMNDSVLDLIDNLF